MTRTRPPWPTIGEHMPLQECIKGQYIRLGTTEASELIAKAARQLAEAIKANEAAKSEPPKLPDQRS